MLQNMNRFQEIHVQKRFLKWIVSGQGQSESNPNLIEFSSSSLSLKGSNTAHTLKYVLNISDKKAKQSFVVSNIFIGPESDHWQGL